MREKRDLVTEALRLVVTLALADLVADGENDTDDDIQGLVLALMDSLADSHAEADAEPVRDLEAVEETFVELERESKLDFVNDTDIDRDGDELDDEQRDGLTELLVLED